MKLQEVDSTINEAVTDWIKAGIGTLGAAAGYSKGATYAQEALAKSHFVGEFTKKISGMLATVWPKIQKQQQAYAAAQKNMQAMAANQPVVYGGRTINPTDPNYDAVKAENQRILQSGTSPDQFDLAGYLYKIIKQYAGGVNIAAYDYDIMNLCNKMARTYQSTRGTAELKAMGELLYQAIKANTPQEQTQSGAAPAVGAVTLKSVITNILPNMSDADLAKLPEAIKQQQDARL